MIPKISYVVAVYNVSDYIEDCIRSLCMQTLKDIEIVIVDDCTPDDSIEKAKAVIEGFPERKSQVKYVHHKKNQGLGFVRRDGFNASTGEYVNFIDGDDYVDPRMAELMYEKAQQTGADQVICDYYEDYGDEKVEKSEVHGDMSKDVKSYDRDVLDCRAIPYVWLKAFRRELFTDHIILWPTKGMGEDTVLSSQISYYSRLTVHVPVPLYYYRQSANSYCRSESVTPEWALSRSLQFQENIRTYCYFLERVGIADQYKHGIMQKKVYAKDFLFFYLDDKECRKKWRRIYPEINMKLIFGCDYYKPSKLERLRTMAICLGVFPLMRKLYHIAKD